MINKPKYSSLSAFIKGVSHVNEPLTDGERLVLHALLMSVDYKTACSRPGNQDLMDISGRSIRGVQEILKFLRAKGLIEIASQGNGRGFATVHRFCVEDAKYPEPRNTICVDNDEEARRTMRVAMGREPRSESKEARSERGEVRSEETRSTQWNGQNHADGAAPLPKTSSIGPSIGTSTTTSSVGVAAPINSEKSNGQEQDNFFSAIRKVFHDSMYSVISEPTKSHKQRAWDLAREHGADTYIMALQYVLECLSKEDADSIFSRVDGDRKKQTKTYLLAAFNDLALDYIELVKPYAETGLDSFALLWVIERSLPPPMPEQAIEINDVCDFVYNDVKDFMHDWRQSDNQWSNFLKIAKARLANQAATV
jgi:hypothetical protein